MDKTSKIPVFPNAFPYNELLITGKLSFKTRNWNYNYRGPILLYTSGRVASSVCRSFDLNKKDFPIQKIVATADLVDVKPLTRKQKETFIRQLNPGISEAKINWFILYERMEEGFVYPLSNGFFFKNIKRLAKPISFAWPQGAAMITSADPKILK